MLTNLQNQSNKNEALNQALASYLPLDNELEQLIRPNIEEDILTDDFITRSGIDSEEFELNMALCREFEGE